MSLTESVPAISVVMGVHNGESYLSECVASILSQTFRDFEFIIIDDGSTDASAVILDDFAKTDSRIVVIHQKNQGLTRSLNIGLELAKGEFVARMDADDVADQHRFEIQYFTLKENPRLSLLGAEVELITQDGLPLGPRWHAHDHIEIRRRLLLGDGGALTHPVVMFPNQLVRECGGYDADFVTGQDLDLFLKLSERGIVSNHPKTLLKWRQHSESINRTRYETWMKMKQLAIANAISRVGPTVFAQEVFPTPIHFEFPTEDLSLARYAAGNGRLDTARHLALRALKKPDHRMSAGRFLLSLFKRQVLAKAMKTRR
jgi:glycosyltransferase involved in cell wall biosynthesis